MLGHGGGAGAGGSAGRGPVAVAEGVAGCWAVRVVGRFFFFLGGGGGGATGSSRAITELGSTVVVSLEYQFSLPVDTRTGIDCRVYPLRTKLT